MTDAPLRGPQQMSVVGCGYLGAVHATAMATLGHTVVGVDADPARAGALASGSVPFYEPGLDALLTGVLETGRLRFTEDIAEAADATMHFLCVGTPQQPGRHHADMSFVEEAVRGLLSILKPGDVVVGKSTVPVGTAADIAERIRASGASLIWNPEFLREGFAIEDTLRPDRVVFGVGPTDEDKDALEVVRDAYFGILTDSTPVVVTDWATAELVKSASNAYLATKISFINAMADLCDIAGGDVVALADAMGHDARIGRRFLNAGLGFGGGCLPKDIRAFMARAGELGAENTLTFLREVDTINLARRDKVVAATVEMLGGEITGARVAALGAAFKPDSDDIRDSPALAVAEALHLLGADVVVTDPQALANAARTSPQLTYAATAEEAAGSAEIVLLLTEWQEFVDLDPEVLGKAVQNRRVLDCRNALDPGSWTQAGWEYRCLGRPGVGR